MENGADLETKDQLSMTPLLLAVSHGACHTVKALLDCGADITAVDSSLNSCLHLAVIFNKPEMVKLLLERDGDKLIRCREKDLKTVFHLAAVLKDPKVLTVTWQLFPTKRRCQPLRGYMVFPNQLPL